MDLLSYLPALQTKIVEHIALSTFAILIACAFAVPLGVWIHRNPLLKRIVLKMGSVSQTVPSLAMLAFLVPILGLGNVPALVVLTFYALYPILRNTTTGLQGVPSECIEAAQSLGFSSFQQLYIVELPLAFSVMISGIRVAAAMTIGITTIAALIGAGGLGDFITQGLALNDSSLILLGAIPTAVLALTFDYGISKLEGWVQNRKTTLSKGPQLPKPLRACIGVLMVVLISYPLINGFFNKANKPIVIASKNFTEQYILAELMAQVIEAKTSHKVDRKFNLGTTAIVHQAMQKGEVDMYPEYTGTAYLTVLNRPYQRISTSSLYKEVKDAYKKEYGFTWVISFGFSNSQALAVQKDFAKKHKLQTISHLAPLCKKLKIAAPPEFLKRQDAFPGLQKVYGLQFQKVMQVDPNLMYTAFENKEIDVIAAFTTDGRLEKHNLVVLEDDKQFYPSYEAAIVIRDPVLKSSPEVGAALLLLKGKIDAKKMAALNALVDSEGHTPSEVAHRFLKEEKILSLD